MTAITMLTAVHGLPIIPGAQGAVLEKNNGGRN